jgi:L-aspartate oxidase
MVARLIIQSAQLRRESRGLHYTLDYPESDRSRVPRNTVLVPPNFAGSNLKVHWQK